MAAHREADIHAVYDRAAREGLVVARLLWGEPSLYGTLRDEIRAARDRGLDYEIVPGITAPSLPRRRWRST